MLELIQITGLRLIEPLKTGNLPRDLYFVA